MGLAATLPSADHLRKILGNAGAERYLPHGEADVLAIVRGLRDFREALADRDIKSTSIDYALDDLGYALRELKRFFKSRKAGQTADMNDKDAYIFAYFIEGKVETLREIAEELDRAACD